MVECNIRKDHEDIEMTQMRILGTFLKAEIINHLLRHIGLNLHFIPVLPNIQMNDQYVLFNRFRQLFVQNRQQNNGNRVKHVRRSARRRRAPQRYGFE